MRQIQYFGDYPVAFCYNYRKRTTSSVRSQPCRMRWQSVRICVDFYPDIFYLVISHYDSGKKTSINIDPNISLADFCDIIVTADKSGDLTSLTHRQCETLEDRLRTLDSILNA